MPESKDGFRKRCQDAGVWEHAKTLRDNIRRELEARGFPVEQAVYEGWRQTMEQYPAGQEKERAPKPYVEPGMLAGDVTSALRARGSVEFSDEVAWVLENRLAPDVTPMDAPSLRAWSLLDWVKADPANLRDFMKMSFAYLGKQDAKPEEEGPSAEQVEALKQADDILSHLRET